jgi:hypothetical protein
VGSRGAGKRGRVKFSTNALSAKYFRRLGWKVEHIQTTRGMMRYDPFGGDLLAIKGPETLLIQACRVGQDMRDHLPDSLRAAKAWCQQLLTWAGNNAWRTERVRGFCLQAWRRRSKRGVTKFEAETYYYDPAKADFILSPDPDIQK